MPGKSDMKIIFVRHGEPDYIHDCLTATGIKQAEATALRLEHEGISEIYASPNGRAQQTAFCTADRLGLPVQTLNFMREISWGDPEDPTFPHGGHPWDLANEMAEQQDYLFAGENWREHPYFRTNTATECYDSITRSMDDFLETEGYHRTGNRYVCTCNHTDKTIAMFGHGGSGACMLSHMLCIPFPQFCRAFPYYFTSVNVIVFDNGKGRYCAPWMALYNDIRHIGVVSGENVSIQRQKAVYE